MMTATDAALKMGVSRKTYYKWEKRGLAALMNGLSDQPTGRAGPPLSSQHEAELEKEVEALKKEKDRLEKQLGLKTLVHELEMDEYQKRTKKK